jgi:hypothetical protein
MAILRTAQVLELAEGGGVDGVLGVDSDAVVDEGGREEFVVEVEEVGEVVFVDVGA